MAAISTPPFHVLTKPIGPICNLDCKYCFYLEKEALYANTSKWAMSADVLESYIQQYIQQQNTDVIHFAWQGGEPTLLGVDYFRNIISLQAKYSDGKRIENAFQTNGVLLNDDWAGFFAENNFLIGISIDGPRELHDAYRVDKGGQPTFDRVMRGVSFLKKHSVAFNTLTTVHRKNSYNPLEVYRFLKESGSGYMQFIPIVERISTHTTQAGMVLVSPSFSDRSRVSDWSVEPVQFGRFLSAIFDEWVHNDVGKTFVQLFDVSLEMWLGMDASLCIFRKTCGSALAVEHNGDLYSCDHFVYPENRLGNIMQQAMGVMVESPQQIQFGQAKNDTLPNYCRQCEVRFACNGECPKHRFATTPDGEAGLNYLCAGYKNFFTHIDPYMQFMAAQLRQQRAPANVMEWVRMRDAAASQSGKPGRNDPCPCGSGKKFKRCCGLSA
ncbi:MAG TPA: anaerobic sulfatase-maturation protein [Acidobacteriaceae bacterium]|nr:anaerobic sulfatase-maturation protein [Acidobacteriaceae bacterium]